jgi:hypothetical protein
MSSVDVFAIEEAMKMAALDQHRGYAKDSHGEVKQDRHTEYLDQSQAAGYQIIREPLWNKGMLSSSLRVAPCTILGSPFLVSVVCPVDNWSCSIYAQSGMLSAP